MVAQSRVIRGHSWPVADFLRSVEHVFHLVVDIVCLPVEKFFPLKVFLVRADRDVSFQEEWGSTVLAALLRGSIL